MTALLALGSALLGAVIGGAAGALAFAGIGLLTGADAREGGVAMAAALLGLPLGAVIGAGLGLWLALRWRRRSGASVIGWQVWGALGLLVAGAGAFAFWLFDNDIPPSFAHDAPRPVLEAEIRLPDGLPGVDYAVNRGAQVRSQVVYSRTDQPLPTRLEPGYTVLSTRIELTYRTADRSLELYLSDTELLVFDLPYAPSPDASETFSDWRGVDHLREHTHGPDLALPEGYDVQIRTRISWTDGR